MYFKIRPVYSKGGALYQSNSAGLTDGFIFLMCPSSPGCCFLQHHPEKKCIVLRVNDALRLCAFWVLWCVLIRILYWNWFVFQFLFLVSDLDGSPWDFMSLIGVLLSCTYRWPWLCWKCVTDGLCPIIINSAANGLIHSIPMATEALHIWQELIDTLAERW